MPVGDIADGRNNGNHVRKCTETEENYVREDTDSRNAAGRLAETQEDRDRRARDKSEVELVGFDEKLRRREEILESISELEGERKRIEQEVKLFMQDSELASSERYRVSWGNVRTTRLDAKRIKQEKPELYREYAKETVSRKFQVRAA